MANLSEEPFQSDEKAASSEQRKTWASSYDPLWRTSNRCTSFVSPTQMSRLPSGDTEATIDRQLHPALVHQVDVQ
jgi:hypothetical protein